MQDDAVSGYVRARTELLKSILDLNDYDTAVANFAFAQANLENHGYIVEKMWQDRICESVLKHELSEEEAAYFSEIKKSDLMERRGAEHTVPAHFWRGRVHEVDLEDAHRVWPSLDPMMDHSEFHYSDVTPFDEKFHPMRNRHKITGRPRWVEVLRGLYLPSAPGERSRIEMLKESENTYERHHEKEEHAAVKGRKKLDPVTDTEKDHHPYLGPLQDSHLHDIYINNYENWLSQNRDLEKEMIERYPNPDVADFELRKLHFEQAADEWESNEVSSRIDPSEGMTQEEFDDAFNRGESLEPIQIRNGLGWLGLTAGMEFLTPEQRIEILPHLMEGSDGHDRQMIDLGGGQKISVGRIKRNIAHRFTGEFHHAGRANIHGGPNLRAYFETPEDHPEGMDYFIKHSLAEALGTATLEGGENIGELLLDSINTALFGGDDERYLSRLPLMNLRALRAARTAAKKVAKETGISYNEALGEEFKHHEERDTDGRVDIDGLYALVGIDRDTKEPVENRFIEGLSEPLLDVSSIFEVFAKAERLAGVALTSKDVRNADMWHHLGFNGPALNQIDPSQQDIWMQGEEGPIGAAALFSSEWQTRGGAHSSPLTIMEMLHDMLPKDEEGYSLFGRLNENGRFEVNPKSVGLFGRYIPMLSTRFSNNHFTPHGVQSFYDATKLAESGTTPRNTKQKMYHGASSSSPGYSNKVKPDSSGVDLLAGIEGQANKYSLSGRHDFQNALLVTGGRQGEATNQRYNSRIKHRAVTAQQQMKPPHDPPKKRHLTRQDILGGKHTLSHNADNINAHSAFQGYSGLEQGGGELTAAQLDEVEALQAQVDSLHLELEEPDITDEAHEEVDRLIEELESQIVAIYEYGGEQASEAKGRKTRRGYTTPFTNHDAKDEADLAAIVEMAKRFKPMYEKEDPSAFDTSDPRKADANMRMLFHDANRALMIMRHEDHGLFTHGYDSQDVDQKTASELLSTEDEVFNPQRNLALSMIQHGVELTPDMEAQQVLEALGFPTDRKGEYSPVHTALAEQIASELDGPMSALKFGDLLARGPNLHPKMDFTLHADVEPNAHSDAFQQALYASPEYQAYRKEGAKNPSNMKGWASKNYLSKLSGLRRFMTERSAAGDEEPVPVVSKYGMKHFPSGSVGSEKGRGSIGSAFANQINRLMHDVVLMSKENLDLSLLAQPQVEQGIHNVTTANYGTGRPIHPYTSMQGHRVHDHFVSGVMHTGRPAMPTVGIEFDANRQPVVGPNMGGEQDLKTVSEDKQQAVFGEDWTKAMKDSGWQHEQENIRMMQPNPAGETPSDDPMDIGKSLDDQLYALMNPDALLKADGKPLPILAMHRIFKVKDLECLRGFSGEWAVSALPAGQRMIVERRSGRVKAYDEDGPVTLEDEDRKHIRALTEKNFIIDVVKTDSEIVLVDILNYDDTNIADMNVRERIKVMRGQMDSQEHVIVPGPHNFRLTDDEGLEEATKNLQEDHDRLLLRDATSTYMKGERRHPKWYSMRANKNIAFIILDVRGKGPFTYRLGAGPLDAEGLGNRGVEHEGKHYLDVGTVQSPKPFNEGDVVSVSVSGVRKKKRNDKTLFDVTASKIVGEADCAAASAETLSLLAKSHDLIHVPFDLSLRKQSVVVSLHGIDDVSYTLEKSSHGFWAHTPTSMLGELSDSTYAVELAQSLAPLWRPATSLMMKATGPTRSMADPKHRRASAKESAGIIEEDDANAIIKPKREELMVKTLTRIVDLYERIAKEKMSGRTSAQGLGIDVGSGIESPRGPTSLTSEQSMPDWDMRERPTEDPEEEYPMQRMMREKRKNREQSADYEAESEND